MNTYFHNLLHHRNVRGFTLVELLVSAAILLVLISVVVTSLANYLERQQYKTEVNDVVRSIIEQRARTVAAEGNNQHGVHLSADTITLFASSTYTYGAADNTLIELGSTDVEFSLSGGVSEFAFSKLTGTSTATGTINLINSNIPATTTLTIYATGLLETTTQ